MTLRSKLVRLELAKHRPTLTIEEFETQLRTAGITDKLKSSLQGFLRDLEANRVSGASEVRRLKDLYQKGYINTMGVLTHPHFKVGMKAAYESTWYTDKWWVTILSVLYDLKEPAMRRLREQWSGGPTTF